MPVITIQLRTVVAFAAGLAVALVALFVFQAWRVDAAPGDSDTTFVPITPCRLIDTRPAPDRVGSLDAFGVDDTKTIQAHGTNGNCTIPAEAVGLSLNVTAVTATAPTFLTVWPDGTRPEASSLNPAAGQPPTPNAVTTNLSGGGAFNMYNLAGTVNVIVDVNGYHISSSLQELDAAVTALEAAAAASGVVPFDFTLSDGESEVFGTTGALSFEATCTDTAGDIEAIIHARTTEDDQVVMDSDDDDFDGSTDFLLPATLAADREMFSNNSTGTSVENDIDGGFILSASGEYLAIDGETLAIGVNYDSADCIFAGTYTFRLP